MLESGSGWQSGMSDDVCLAARIPASRAVCSGSPFFAAPARICLSASRDIAIDPRATASRAVTGLPPTSTILTRPRASTWDRRAALSFLGIALLLREEEGEALERHREIDALQLHVRRHLQRARRKIQHRLDARGDDEVEHVLRRRRRH